MKKLLVAVVVTLCSGLPVGRIQNSYADGSTLDFNTLVREALATSPEAAKIDATLAERMAEAFATKVHINPEVNVGVDNPISRKNGEKNELVLTLSQTIRPSDFGERTLLAHIIEQTGGIEKQIALTMYVQSLNVLYSRAWQFQETGLLLKDAQKRATQFLDKVSDGVDRGIFSEGDIALFRAEQKSFEADSAAALAELLQISAELSRLSGLAIMSRKLQKPEDVLPISKDALAKLARESALPIQQRVNLSRDLAQKQLEVARLDSFQAVTPSLGYSRHDDGIDQVTFGFSIPLPIFNRNQSGQIRSQGALVAAQREQQYLTSELLIQEINFVYDSFQSLKKQSDLFENGVIPARKKAVDVYFRQFEAGLGTSFQLWQSLRELNASRLRAVQIRSSLAGARGHINALIGKQI